MRRRLGPSMRCLSLVFLVWHLVPQDLRGQDAYGSLQGTVSDDTNAVLPGALVTVTNVTTGKTVSTSSGAYGNFAVRNLESGSYSVAFALSGFTRAEFPSIQVLLTQNLTLNVVLHPGPVSTTVQVIGIVPLIDTQSSTVAFHVPEAAFNQLPKTRTFQDLAILAPRVNTGEIEGGIQVNGASGAENTFLIDGLETNSALNGLSRQDALFEYVQEVQVETSGIDARYRGATGGVVSVVTRSGGNQFHGNGWLYYAGDSLRAAPPNRLVLGPLDNSTVGYFQDAKAAFRSVEPGFAIGGPVLRNRLYFFTSWDSRWSRTDQPYDFNNGLEPGSIRRERTQMSGFNKVSYDSGSRVRANLSWLWTPSSTKGVLPAYNGFCSNCLSSSATANDANHERGSFNPQSNYAANVNIALRPNMVLTGRAGYFWDNFKDSGIPNLTSVQYRAPAVAPLVPPELEGGIGFQNTPAIAINNHDRVARSSAGTDISIAGGFSGFHNLKGGFGVEKIVNDVNRFYPGGYVYIWWDQTFTSLATGIADRGTYGYYEVNDFRTLGSAGALTKNLYVQDSWRVGGRLTLNVGVRLEPEKVPSFRRDVKRSAIDFGWGDKLSPRIGAAYDLLGDGRFRVFGSWGRYFDPTRYELARTVFGAEIWRTYYRSLDTLDVFSINLGNMPGRDLWNPGVTLYRDRRNAVAGLNSVASDLKPMSEDQWSIGGDYQWRSDATIGVHYAHQNLRRVIEDLAVLVQGNASYIYANPGEGSAITAPFVTGLTARPLDYPKPLRNYDAVEVRFEKRPASRWFGSFSYTWSRLFGNYSGPASSDELLTPVTGLSYGLSQEIGGQVAHPARNANLAWDLDEILFDSRGNLDVRGRLATDRPHVLKWSGGYTFDRTRFGQTTLGGFFYLGSGTPLSTQVYTRNLLPVFVNGRGDMGRTPALSYTDLQVAHSVNLTEAQRLRFELSVLNVFNQRTVRHRFTALNRGTGVFVDSSAIDLSNVDLRSGYDYNSLIEASADGSGAFDPRYGKDDLFSEGLSARLGLKWSF